MIVLGFVVSILVVLDCLAQVRPAPLTCETSDD